MLNRGTTCWLALLGMTTFVVAKAQTSPTQFEANVRPALAKQCFQCHGDKVQMAGVDFSTFRDASGAASKPELWRKVREKIEAHLMPPPPLPGLSASDAAAVTGWIDFAIGASKADAVSNPGRVTARRLNRVEFNNTIRDFLGISVRPADEFPVDNQGYGFDNIGDVLTLSPMLMEKYMAAARSVARIAVYGESYEKKPGLIGKLLVKSIQDDGQVSGNMLPFSMRGTLEGTYDFPVEADYVLQFRISNRRGRGPSQYLNDQDREGRLEASRRAEPPVEFDVDLDERQVLKDVVEGDEAYAYSRAPTVIKVHAKAGEHRIHAYFPDNAKLDDPRTNLNRDGRRRLAADFVEILGPYNPVPSHAPNYEKIFVCSGHDAACTRKIVESLARRGFRRPPTEAEIQRLLKLVAMVQKQGDSFEEGIRIALQSILVSPDFLFRIERDPASANSSPYQVNDYELASRLSYFLWSSMPDDELFKLAAQHRLADSAVMQAQVKRMLHDPKAANLVDDFAAQWLDLRALDHKKPDPLKFPKVDDELLVAMRRETLLFVGAVDFP